MEEIYLVRGDTLQLSICNIKTQNGEDYVLSDTDVIYLDVKANAADKVAVFSKSVTAAKYDEQGTLPITILPEDTVNLAPRDYFFDVRLFMDEDNIYTIVPMSKLKIVRNITDIPKGAAGNGLS